MIEIIFGVLGLAGGIGLAFGILNGLLPLGGLAFTGGGLVASLGSLLLAHGLYRIARQRTSGSGHGLRTRALMVTAVLTAAFLTFAMVALFGQLTVSGVPVGYHAVAEALPLALLLLFLASNRRQSAIDREALSRPQSWQEPRHDA
jgi:hypothetical protein